MQAVCRVNHPAAGDGSKRLAAGDAKPAPAFHKSSAVVTTAMGQVTSAVQSSCESRGFGRITRAAVVWRALNSTWPAHSYWRLRLGGAWPS
jgi:hypothetical protein